jgi:hypothetical protein
MAKDRIERKRVVASLRREIRKVSKDLLALAQDLQLPGSDVWGLCGQIRSKTNIASYLQSELNARIGRGDEVAIIRRANKKAKDGSP